MDKVKKISSLNQSTIDSMKIQKPLNLRGGPDRCMRHGSGVGVFIIKVCANKRTRDIKQLNQQWISPKHHLNISI